MKTQVMILFFFIFCVAPGAVYGTDTSSPAVSRSTSTTNAQDKFALTVKVPIMSPGFSEVPLAMVNDDPVTMGDLTAALGTSHQGREESKKQTGKIDFPKMLDRLINVKLVIQEAVRIGLDELPEFKTAEDDYAFQTQAGILASEVTKDVKADPAAVEKRYKDMVAESKIRSLFFEKEEDAKSVLEVIKAGKNFEETADKAVADKKATGDQKSENYVKLKDLLPHVAAVVSGLEIGAVSPLIQVRSGKKPGFTILKVEDRRYPENAEAREKAERAVLSEKKAEVGFEFKKGLRKKYAIINEKLVRKLDYDSSNEKKLEQLLKDNRVIVEIKDEKPITVAELTEALQKKHFHGLVQAAKSRKLNSDKQEVLFLVIDRRVIQKEITERGFAKRQEFQDELKEFKSSSLFGLFVEKVVFPDVKITEQDLKAYFDAHKKEYQYPEMIKMGSIAFTNKGNAESALKELKKGAEINWVRSNAEGLAAGGSEENALFPSETVLSTKTLPEDMRAAIAGVRKGDFRLYEQKDRFYVLAVEEIIPARQQPYEEVRDQMTEKVFEEKMTKAIDDWFVKLRANSTVKVYI